MAKRVTVTTELTAAELHERYRSAAHPVERTRLPYPVADEGGPHARGDRFYAWLYGQVGSHHCPALE